MLPAESMTGKLPTQRGVMNRRAALMLTAGAFALAGCNGWPSTEAYRYPDAMHTPEKYPTYAPTPAEEARMFVAGNHRYMVLPGSVNLRSAPTRAVGTAGSASVFSIEGDEAPYSNLFARSHDGSWRAAAVID